VSNAERFIRLRFPECFRLFLRTWGTLAIGPYEFYGIAGTDFENSRVPNGIWFTKVKRRQLGLPEALIVICDNNGDDYSCIDTGSDGQIVAWDVATRRVVGKKADDVFAFILEECKDFLP